MSNPFRAIGKAFSKVVSVVKKIALPALAIGAVVLTGGAALGLLPSVGTVLGGLGLSPALTGILATAAKGATFGAVGSALTGGNIISGATTGLIMGGAMGGIGALAGRGAQAAQAATQGAGEAAGTVANSASVIPPAAPGASFSEAFAPFQQGGGGLGQGASVIDAAGSALPGAGGGIAPVAGGLAQPVVSTAPVPTSGDFLSQLFNNPMQGFGLMQGLGRGLSAAEDAKAQQEEIERRERNYSDTSGLFRLSSEQGQALPDAASVYNSRIYGKSKLAYDPKTGRIMAGA